MPSQPTEGNQRKTEMPTIHAGLKKAEEKKNRKHNNET